MTPQNFPLWLVFNDDAHPGVKIIIGWAPGGLPIVVDARSANYTSIRPVGLAWVVFTDADEAHAYAVTRDRITP